MLRSFNDIYYSSLFKFIISPQHSILNDLQVKLTMYVNGRSIRSSCLFLLVFCCNHPHFGLHLQAKEQNQWRINYFQSSLPKFKNSSDYLCMLLLWLVTCNWNYEIRFLLLSQIVKDEAHNRFASSDIVRCSIGLLFIEWRDEKIIEFTTIGLE